MTFVEALAVALALIYLWLAARQNLWCWAAAFVSSWLFAWLMWQAQLLAEFGLQLTYVALAVYGWWHWRYGAGQVSPTLAAQPRFSWQWHLIAIGLLSIVAALVAMVLARYTEAQAVWLDTYTTVYSLFATWLLTRKAIENWWYWLVIDGAYIYLYVQQQLWLLAGLFALYVVMVVYAIWQWRQGRRQLPLEA